MSIKEGILKVIGGEHVAALATVQEGKPAVRFLALLGMDDLTLIGATMKSSRKVAQIRKNPAVALSIWSGKNYADPFVMIQGRGSVHEDLETKEEVLGQKSLSPISKRRRIPNTSFSNSYPRGSSIIMI